MSINVCTFSGRIGRDAVTRQTQSGKDVTGFSLAVDVGWGERKSTLWLDCSIWGDRGAKLAAHLLKGTTATVSGSLSTEEYQGTTKLRLDVRDVQPEWQKRDNAGPPRQQQADDFADDAIPF